MAKKRSGPPYPSTSTFRDSYRQTKYCIQSQSRYKDDKEAAHIVSLHIAKAALSVHRSPGRPPVEERADVKGLLNDPSNLTMVKKETNRVVHVRLDNAIITKSMSGERLTKEEQKRAKKQVKVIQGKQDCLEKVTYDCFKQFYRELKTQDGRVVWDARHDRSGKS